MEYDDFSISFSATGNGNFKVSARHSDGSEEKGTFLLPPSLQVFLEAGQRLTGASAETTRGPTRHLKNPRLLPGKSAAYCSRPSFQQT